VPITITVNAAERLRYSVFSGDIGDRELIAAFRRSMESPDFDPTLNGLVDLRAVQRLDVTSSGIWELAQVLRVADRSRTARRVAIVAPSDFQFGMARMAATLLSTGGLATEYHAFRDMTEAREWLGLGTERQASGELV
jgi:hypothetical protein